VRLIAGGAALQLTRDDADHEAPRWAPDGASLVYYSPPTEGERLGTVWEVPALGGAPRRIASAIGGADISHDGTRVAFFRAEEDQVQLVVASRDGTASRVIAKLPFESYYISPRWSPDDKSIAYQSGYVFTHDIFAVPTEGGEPRRISREARLLSGFCWTPDGAGIVYSSARASTVLYLPTFNLWTARLDGSGLRQLTFGEASYVDPDLDASGLLVTSRNLRSLNIWKFPTDGNAIDNVRRAVQITRQTGQVQTPSVGPNDREIVYLSDSGGHGNLWITDTTTGASRQLTYEQDPDVILGVPVWSPDGRHIAFYATRDGVGGNWLVNPDGGDPRELIRAGGWATWSSDGRWMYYNENTQGSAAIGALKKVQPEGGPSIAVRDDKGNRPAIAPDGSTLYFVVERAAVSGGSDYEIRVASPENGPSRVLAQIPARRIPLWQLVHPVLSPDGKWLALPLTDGFATNIWALPTSGGPLRQLTDFGRRPTYIARRVSWSADGKAVFAAVGEGDADVVLLRGLKP
jgi:Tol biopolymer transport system component